MANLLRTGAVWLKNQVKLHASESVTYMRGSQQVGSDLKATIGETGMEQDSDSGIIRCETKDFIIPVEDLTLNGAVIEPLRGDRITDADGYVYEVLGLRGEPPTRPDEYHQRIRVHTKQVTAVAT